MGDDMNKYELYVQQIDLIDTFVSDMNNGTSKLKSPSDAFYYRFFSGQLLKEEVVELIPNIYISTFHNMLEAIWKGNITSTGVGYYGNFIGKDKLIDGLNSIKTFLPVGDMLLAREGWVPRVDSVALSGESIGGFTEPGRIKQTLVMNKILWQEDKILA